MSKVTIIGGSGIRTPLLIHSLTQARLALGITEIALYDIDHRRLELIATLSREVARQIGGEINITTPPGLEEAVEGASFVISSIRVGGITARARDERLAIENGIAGQETTGLGGLAMALRTIPVTLEHGRMVEKLAPDAWFISFTNPAGLITQALSAHTKLKLIGICDTPSELFHRIAQVLNCSFEDVHCDYFGLNHLGWVKRVMLGSEDVMDRLLNDDKSLRRLYHADLFDPSMIRALGLIPSEYLFFYYEQQRALANQRKAGSSRGEEIAKLNAELFEELQPEIKAVRPARALTIYKDYLRRRSGSYMKLEAEAGSALQKLPEMEEDPFETATGYHKIALDVMKALVSEKAVSIVVNINNNGAIADMKDDDIVEVPCMIDKKQVRPNVIGDLPDSVRGLVLAVKEYERLTIRAAIEKSRELARLALMTYPLIGQWHRAGELMNALIETDIEHLGYLR